MDFLFELLIEIYMEMMMLIVPERKTTSRAYRTLAIVIALVGVTATMVSLIFGLTLIIDHNNMMGIIPLTIAAVLSVGQITMGIIVAIRRK